MTIWGFHVLFTRGDCNEGRGGFWVRYCRFGWSCSNSSLSVVGASWKPDSVPNWVCCIVGSCNSESQLPSPSCYCWWPPSSGLRSRDSSDATPLVPSWVCWCVGSSSLSPTKLVLTTPTLAADPVISCSPPRTGVSSTGNWSSVPSCVWSSTGSEEGIWSSSLFVGLGTPSVVPSWVCCSTGSPNSPMDIDSESSKRSSTGGWTAALVSPTDSSVAFSVLNCDCCYVVVLSILPVAAVVPISTWSSSACSLSCSDGAPVCLGVSSSTPNCNSRSSGSCISSWSKFDSWFKLLLGPVSSSTGWWVVATWSVPSWGWSPSTTPSARICSSSCLLEVSS